VTRWFLGNALPLLLIGALFGSFVSTDVVMWAVFVVAVGYLFTQARDYLAHRRKHA
jgi:sterol desaturase/sphingolipid hydroxylase (fatty acid hydroxylase superfamily)